MSDPRIVRLPAKKLTAESFAPFGICAAEPAREADWTASGSRIEGVREDVRMQGTPVARLWNLGDLIYKDDVPFIGFVRYFNQGFRLAQLERHIHETQTWICRRGTAFVVVAPAGDNPTPESAAAFVIEPGDLISFGQGVWMCHFFPILDDADFLVMTARREPEQDRDLVNFVHTHNAVLEIVLP
jgi:ureidoglycolate hydrolase